MTELWYLTDHNDDPLAGPWLTHHEAVARLQHGAHSGRTGIRIALALFTAEDAARRIESSEATRPTP